MVSFNDLLKNIARSILKDELSEYSGLKKEKDSLTKINNELTIENKLLKTQINNESESDRLINEYPSKLVYYKGRVLPNSSTMIKVPVTVLITPTDGRIIQDLKEWNLYQINEDIETWIPKIYKKVMQTYYSYALDENVWGLTELWEFPFEDFAKYDDISTSKNKFKLDCDSFGILLVSYMRAAGIPPGYVWCVAGSTIGGFGHLTFYAYSKKINKFVHLNSTSTIYYNNLSEYPTHADARSGKDTIGIAETWLSFNDVCSRSTFDTDTLEELMNSKKK